MSTKLCIQISSAARPRKLELEFLYNEEWTPDAEVLLLQRIHEILSLVRHDGLSVDVNLDLIVKDPDQAFFLYGKIFTSKSKRAFATTT